MGRRKAKIQDIQDDGGYRKASSELHPTEPKPDVIRISSQDQVPQVRNVPFKLKGYPCDANDGIRYLSHYKTGLVDKLREFMTICFADEISTPLYQVFKGRLSCDPRDASRVMSEVEFDVLYKFRHDPVKMACHVLETCRKSLPFRQACCLLGSVYKPYKDIAYEDMLKQLCNTWFSVNPEELQKLWHMNEYLFQHFYEGNVLRPGARFLKISGMHWGYKFWDSYGKSMFNLGTEIYSESLNFSTHEYASGPDNVLYKKSHFYGVSIPFEMSAIFPLVCYNWSYLNFTLKDERLRLILRRSSSERVYTAYFRFFYV